MRRFLSLACLLCLAACSHQQASDAAATLTAPVVFVDAAGNRMSIVEPVAPPPPGAAVTPPAAESEARASPGGLAEAAQAVATEAGESPHPAFPAGAAEFQGEHYLDSGQMDQELARRNQQRFFLVPDGSGRQQTLSAGNIGAFEPGEPAPQYPSPVWQTCRVILPLLPVKERRFHELRFPASDGKQNYAGFRLQVSEGLDHLTLWSYRQRGHQAIPVLARLDIEGRVLEVVNNMPTLSIPETSFRHARSGGRLDMREQHFAQLAVLDAGLLRDRLSGECRMPGLVQDAATDGVVTLQFTTTGEK